MSRVDEAMEIYANLLVAMSEPFSDAASTAAFRHALAGSGATRDELNEAIQEVKERYVAWRPQGPELPRRTAAGPHW